MTLKQPSDGTLVFHIVLPIGQMCGHGASSVITEFLIVGLYISLLIYKSISCELFNVRAPLKEWSIFNVLTKAENHILDL